MRNHDNYSIKNASLGFKVRTTLWLAINAALLLWSWFISLTIIDWYSTVLPARRVVGDELQELAWTKPGLFLFLLGMQVLASLGLWSIARSLFRRSTLRRRMQAVLSKAATTLVALNLLVWITVPFVRWSQLGAGDVGLVTAATLILLPIPALWQMWFYTRWRNAGSVPTRVIVVGGGFAGLYTAMGLDHALGYHPSLDLTVIDQRNFFLFPPLLPSAAVGTIETRQVTYPFRRIFETTNIHFKKGAVTSVDPLAGQVHLRVHVGDEASLGTSEMIEQTLPYDYLVLAPGSTTQTFNTKGVEEYALFVRELEDAIAIRNRIIDAFERAAAASGEMVRRELLRFAIVGGGPTGIETATEIRDLIHEVLLKRYPEIDPSWPEVSVIQSGPQLLPGWPDDVVQRTTDQVKRLGIRLILNTRVVEVKANEVVLKDGTRVEARTCLWCAGVQPSPLLQACRLPLDKSGRVPINKDLRVEGFPNVFVLGDAATCLEHVSGKPLPPLGQVAFQQGSHTASNLIQLLKGQDTRPFHYFNYGSLVSVGEHYAAVNLLGVKISGFPGWLIWRFLYLTKILGFSNRIRIVVDWTLDLLIERSITQFRTRSVIKAPVSEHIEDLRAGEIPNRRT